MPARREFHLGARTRVPNPSVHHLLQHDHGPSLQLDLHRQTPPAETPPSFRSAPPPRQAATTTQTTKACTLMKLSLRVVALAGGGQSFRIRVQSPNSVGHDFRPAQAFSF